MAPASQRGSSASTTKRASADVGPLVSSPGKLRLRLPLSSGEVRDQTRTAGS